MNKPKRISNTSQEEAGGRVDCCRHSGLGAIVAVRKLLAPDRVLELSSLTPTVEKVFRLTRMDSIFTIHPSHEVAIANGTGG